MLLASEELQELEVRLGPRRDDAGRSSAEELLALSGPIPEQPEAPFSYWKNGDGPEAVPRDAVCQVGAEGLIVKVRGPDGHVTRAPRNVRQAPATDISMTELLEGALDARGPFVLTAAVPGSCDDIEDAEAHTAQLALEDPRDVRALLARTMHDVCQHGQALAGRGGSR